MKMYTLVEGDYQAIDLPNYLDFNCIFFFLILYVVFLQLQ